MKRLMMSSMLSVALVLSSQFALAGAEEGKAKAEVCAACHGPDGNSASGAFPILAGQSSRYIYLQLKDFKEGRRKDPMMTPMVANLSKQDLRDLADFYASQKQKPNGFKAEAERVSKGKATSDAALCPMCHLGGFSGQNEVPRVAGQHQEYIYKQLIDFKNKNRTNDAGNMTAVLRTLSDDDLMNLSHYIANLN